MFFSCYSIQELIYFIVMLTSNHKNNGCFVGEYVLLFLWVLFLGGCANLRQTLDSSGKRSSEISKEQQNQATIRVIDGALYDVKEDRARAILEYEEALQYDSAAGIHLAISKDYSLLGKHTPAIRHAREALRLDPENTDYRQNLADIYLAARDLESALKEYEAIVQRDPTSIRVLYTIGRIHQQRQQYPKALEIYKTIRDRFGPSWQTLFQMATVYEWLKQLDSAATMYQEMLMLDPNNSELKKRLAGTYLRANKPDTALVFLNELHRQDSADVEINITRGSVYIQKKEWETAFSIFLPIVMRDSITVEAALGLGVEFLRASPIHRVLFIMLEFLASISAIAFPDNGNRMFFSEMSK